MAEDRAIHVRDLSFGYAGGFRLVVPCFDAAAGRRVAVVGPSGSGKTTFLHLIAGILPVAQGALRVAGTELVGLPDDRRRAFRVAGIGLVFQEFELLEHLSVRENALLPYLVTRALRLDEAVERRLVDVAARCGIDHLLDRRPRSLSQGERQRVAICRALVPEPEVVLADEPTGNLDPATTGAVLDLLLERVAELGATCLMVTHDHGLLERFDEVVDLAAVVGGAS